NAAMGINIIDIQGEITAQAESALTDNYAKASANAHAVVLNFTGLNYMNSSGIGLLVTLLIRAQRQQIRVLAYGLTDNYHQIFELTRLNEAILLFVSEDEAIAAV